MAPGTAVWAVEFFGDPGAPGSAQGKRFETNKIVTIPMFGRSMRVHEDAVRAWRHLDLLFRYHNPRYWKQVNDGTYDDWGFSHRYIAGTKTLSMHAFGLATDLDATKNPRTSNPNEKDSYIWKNARESILKVEEIGFMRWGGRYNSPDPMHFEVMWTPAKIRQEFEKDGSWQR